MPKVYNIQNASLTEDDLLLAARQNILTVGEVLSYYTGEVKLARVLEELEDSGDIHRWSVDCRCSDEDLEQSIIESFDNKANLRVYRMIDDLAVRASISIGNNRLFMHLDVLPSEE